MAEVVNLRRVRKRKERLEKDTGAAANRAAFGRTKAEKLLTRAELALEKKRLDGQQRND